MPTLPKYNIQEIILPKSGAKIKIKDGFAYGEILDAQIKEYPSDQAYQLQLALILITEWDLTDGQNNILPITTENLRALDNTDGIYLLAQVNKFLAEKKN
jgi:hypothetical protein